MKKYFEILGLEEGASIQEIQDAYDKLSVELDPKNNDDLDFFKEEFALIKKAYKKLMEHHNKGKSNQAAEKLSATKNQVKDDKSNKTESGSDAITPLKDIINIGSDKPNKKQASTQEESSNQSKEKNSDQGEEDIPKPNKSNKVLIRSLCAGIFLLFGITYLIFQKKVEKVKSEIPIIENREFTKNQERLKYWKNKFEAEYEYNFNYDSLDSKTLKDTTVSFFVYKKNIPFNGYKDCFFECLYKKNENEEFYDNFSVIDLTRKKYNTKTTREKYIYVDLMYKTTQKHNISKDEFEKLIIMATGEVPSWREEHPFIKEDITSIDENCLNCMSDYLVSHKINSIAITDFKDFVKQYLIDKKAVTKANRAIERKYNSRYNEHTSGVNYSLKNKIKSKVNNSNVVKSEKETHNFYGSDGGLGTVKYSFNKKTLNSSTLDKIVNDLTREHYKNNSLITGSQPYSYCYGNNPYCSPPRGYSECSYIDVRASNNSDVMVIIKKNNRVYSHAYIRAGGYHKFKLGNGRFQTFFYYGKGWNPDKFIKNAGCGVIYGGFVSNESLDKSDEVYLYNSTMSYTLYTVENGNFSPKLSNKNEAF